MLFSFSVDLPYLSLYHFRYGFWIKSMKSDDQSRYFCADKEDDMMKIMAAIIKTKVSSKI